MSSTEDLRQLARDVVRLADGRPEADRARRLGERLCSGRFSISVVGEFKRGKSTLVNALLGEDVVPTGAVPLTAIRTELAFGDPEVVVEFLDGRLQHVGLHDLAGYVTEAGNPGNRMEVVRASVRGQWDLLAGGVVLVDTPGVGSVYEHNSEEARAALLDSDGAIVVLAADAPLSSNEYDMLALLRERRAPAFFVLNKVDHLAPEDLTQVREFLSSEMRKSLGRVPRTYEIDARRALRHRLDGDDRPIDRDFVALLSDLRSFVRDDLVGALEMAARRELAEIGHSLEESLSIEHAALQLDLSQLRNLLAALETAAEEQRLALADDRTLLRRDVSHLEKDIRTRLDDFARSEPAEHVGRIEAAAASVPAGEMEAALRDLIASSVEESFESFRRLEADRADQEWRRIAEFFRGRVESRVASVRDSASRLLNIDLPRPTLPRLTDEEERFFYHFLRVGSSTDPLTSIATKALPPGLVRRRTLRRARDELRGQFAKHAGRAGWDLQQRLDEASRKLERSMAAELENSIRGIVDAAERARDNRASLERDVTDKEMDTRPLRELAVRLCHLWPPAEADGQPGTPANRRGP